MSTRKMITFSKDCPPAMAMIVFIPGLCPHTSVVGGLPVKYIEGFKKKVRKILRWTFSLFHEKWGEKVL